MDGNRSYIETERIKGGRFLYRVYWQGEPRSVWGSRYEANMALLRYTYDPQYKTPDAQRNEGDER